MKVAFTGTQVGMTPQQEQEVRFQLNYLRPTMAFHGDCVGADADFHRICREVNGHIYIRSYPPVNPAKRAYTEANEEAPKQEYLARNRTMARLCDILIATPREMQEVLRSGTWSTIRYAREYGKRIVIVYPGGQSITEQPRK
jgi:hypothetical protein